MFLKQKNSNFKLIITYTLFIATLFFFTGDIQEDSLITFRTAKNFALHNEFSYNLGESLPGSTSIIYGFLCGLIYKLVGFFGEKVFFYTVTQQSNNKKSSSVGPIKPSFVSKKTSPHI